MRIEEEYKKNGYFWLPGKEDKKIPGVLTINDGGEIELKVMGFFGESYQPFFANANLPRIIGDVERDGYVTLDNCLCTKQTNPWLETGESEIFVHTVLTRATWGKDEELKFDTFSFAVDCLDEWVGISGIDVLNDLSNRSATINFKLPEKFSFALDNGMELEICFACTTPGLSNLTEAKITQRTYLKLSSKELRDMSEFTETAFKLTNLMCFAMDETVAMKDVSATSSEKRDERNRPVLISVYYSSLPYTEKVPDKKRHEMLFNFGAIKGNAQHIFNSWINAYDYLSPALGLYFSTKTGVQKYLDGKFLALAQGLETYHRRTNEETLMNPKEYNSLVNTLVENCPREHIDWLKARLKHGNEISLRKRLERIIEPFKNYLGPDKDRKKLLGKIVDTRNYLTHYTESLEEQVAKGKELWVLCLKIEAIFSLHFMKVIGFTDDEINSVVENCYTLKRKINPE